MATILTFVDGQRAYPHVVNYVINHGIPRGARGLPTLDCAHVTVELVSPERALPFGCGRRVNPAIAALEAVQLIGAFSDPELCVRVAPNFQRYREASGVFHGAYGRRINGQLAAAITKIRNDPDTRQAVMTLWDPHLDNQPGKKDYPCTIALRLTLTHDRLDLDVLMRSNDVWLGTPYDIFQFTQLQLTAARLLDVEPGTYRHTAWSLHIYRENIEAAENLSVPSGSYSQPVGLGAPGEDVHAVQARARRLHLAGDPGTTTPSERWYRDRLHAPASVVG